MISIKLKKIRFFLDFVDFLRFLDVLDYVFGFFEIKFFDYS